MSPRFHIGRRAYYVYFVSTGGGDFEMWGATVVGYPDGDPEIQFDKDPPGRVARYSESLLASDIRGALDQARRATTNYSKEFQANFERWAETFNGPDITAHDDALEVTE